MIGRSLVRTLSGACSVAALATFAVTAQAQTSAPPSPSQVDADAPEAPPASDIVVTGSRIVRPEIALPSPVESFSAENITQSGKTNLTDFLTDSPALTGSVGNEQNAGSSVKSGGTGVNLLNLRNLGTARTLVLVNGRRHVNAFPGENSVDINTIPVDLIERVDILTGGASAIYGADAVSGVVNFVLKRNFDGLSARAQAGISSRGDAGTRFGSVVAGRNFSDGRGNVTVAYEYAQQDRFNRSQRRYTADPRYAYSLLQNPKDYPVDNPNVPDRILFNNLSWSDSALNGAVDLDLDFVMDVDGDGRPYDSGTYLPNTGFLATNSRSNTPAAAYLGDFTPYLERHNVNLLTSYEFTPAFRFFAEGKFVSTKAFTEGQPSFDSYTYLAPDNYFLRQRFGNAAPDGAYVSRDNFDLGVSNNSARRKTYRVVAGFDGDLTKGLGTGNLHYELSYVYGRTDATTVIGHRRVTDRYYAALDAVIDPATGKVTCRINLPGQTIIDPDNYAGIAKIIGANGRKSVSGAPLTFQPGQCVPLSILGSNVASQAAIDFVFADNVTKSSSTQHVASASLSGDLGFLFRLPGGPIGFAVGAEYRREETRSTPSAYQQGGFFDGGAQILPSKGAYDVKEAFAEVNAPLLANLPFVENLSVGAAVRFSDYSTIGRTTTWKLDGSYSPVRDISFRGTYSQAVRAPNITELFKAVEGTYQFVTDPCDKTLVNKGTQYRVANCQASLTAAGLNATQIAAFNPQSNAVQTARKAGLQTGNANLKEETARTWTAGVVLRPRFIPGLAVTADWYDIKIRNAITTPAINDLLQLCVDQPTLKNSFCGSFTRASQTGFINSYIVSAQNVAAFTTSGLEVGVNYRFAPSPSLGTFNLHLVGGYLNDLTYVATVGGVPEQQRNLVYKPKYQGNLDLTWSKGALSLNYGLNWQGKTRRFTYAEQRADPDISDPAFFYRKERWEHDIQASYDVGEKFTLYGGVNNFTDQQPEIATNFGYPVSAVGRFMYVGAKMKLK